MFVNLSSAVQHEQEPSESHNMSKCHPFLQTGALQSEGSHAFRGHFTASVQHGRPTEPFRVRAIQRVDLPFQSLAPNRQYRDTVTCLPTHTHRTGIVTVAKVRIICTRSGGIVILPPPTHQQREKNDCGRPVNQRCTTMTKLVLRSNPHACAQTAVQQMMFVR